MSGSQVPVLEMLWEAHDPHRALDARFGFGDARAAGRWVADVLNEHWGVRVDSCERIVMSGGNALAWVDTPSGRRLAKRSVLPDRFPRLAEVARLTSWLDGQGLPVSAPVPTRDGRLQVEADGVSLGLQRVIEGDLLDTTDPGQVRAAGAVLARLHDVLAAYPHAERFATLAVASPPLTQQITEWLDSRAAPLPAVARDVLRGLVAGAPPDRLPRQLVHVDFRSANVLCAGGEITAVLDFEEARHDHRLVDLARATVLLGTRYHDWGPVPPEAQAQFLAGYQAVRPLTSAEAGWWDILLLWQALAMVPPGEDPTGWGPSALSRLPRP
ncbi:phosphotransferase [Micromonospora sp. PTRAS2]|uniref:phosphotransferase n=1 Tax=unclassified Micromonospora TaxID=2617518 RepID=UPI00098CFD3F|nr:MULTISPECIES: phosphotransferase [unclassified Micromonospora]MDI5938677.1 phosphotransferase [Micromonospora sp. DH15]OON30643.1 aminoglycoside phosphotransferase [Micromonospora sp. Rc5]